MDHSFSIASEIAGTANAITGARLCRVWLLGPGDLCATCAMAAECDDRRECLHLAASVGTSGRLDGPWRRFPLGAREVGRVARSLEPHLLVGVELTAAGLADPGWLSLHHIAAFGVWPIAAAGRCVGVFAFFAPREPDEMARRALDGLGRLAGEALSSRASGGMRAVLTLTPAAVVDDRAGVTVHEGSAGSGGVAAASMAEVQRRAILATLARTGGRVSGPGGAAELLGMKPTTLESRIRRLGMRKPPRMQMR